MTNQHDADAMPEQKEPERIWIEWHTSLSGSGAWQIDGDMSHNLEYVRADLFDALTAERDTLNAINKDYHAKMMELNAELNTVNEQLLRITGDPDTPIEIVAKAAADCFENMQRDRDHWSSVAHAKKQDGMSEHIKAGRRLALVEVLRMADDLGDRIALTAFAERIRRLTGEGEAS